MKPQYPIGQVFLRKNTLIQFTLIEISESADELFYRTENEFERREWLTIGQIEKYLIPIRVLKNQRKNKLKT